MLDVLTIKLYKLSKPVAPEIDFAKIVKIIYSAKLFLLNLSAQRPDLTISGRAVTK